MADASDSASGDVCRPRCGRKPKAKPPLTCAHCGVQYPVRGRKPTIYCSLTCASRANGQKKLATRKTATCPSCKTRFEVAKSSKRIYCCRTCWQAAKAAKREARPQPIKLRYRVRIIKTCKTCGVEFRPMQPSGRQKRGESSWGVYCSRACAHQGRRIAAAPAAPLPSCAVCGAACSNRNSRTCGDTCRSEYISRRGRLRSEAMDVRDRTARPCACCGMLFAPGYGDKRRRFCSPLCLDRHSRRTAKAARRARNGGRRAERSLDPFKVFERDGWKCRLCGRKTPRSARGKYCDNAPELDHILPLALGGAHDWENVQCACRKCNQAKGATPKGQLMLFPSGGQGVHRVSRSAVPSTDVARDFPPRRIEIPDGPRPAA